MHTGGITEYFDVAQVVLYMFWIFFAGLIYYLRQEDKREGYPMVTDGAPYERSVGFPPLPKPKAFYLAHGEPVLAPRDEPISMPVNARPSSNMRNAPLEPVGNPLLSGIGPGAYANRADTPDMTFEGEVKIVPMRAAKELFIPREDPDPRGAYAYGGDGKPAGKVVDMWVDKSEMIIRYLEIETNSGKRVLAPMPLARVSTVPTKVTIRSIYSTQFDDVPPLKNPDQITFLEEDKVCAYYGAGTLYADAKRAEPLL
jgi:photosynthetic reaction center H subunit